MVLQILDLDCLILLKDGKTIEANLNKYQNYKNNDWLNTLCDKDPFINTKYDDIDNIDLDMSSDYPPETDFENVKRVYSSLLFLSDSNAADERLWAAMCLTLGYNYVRYRWNLKTPSNIIQHIFFGYGGRRSLTRNAMARLWWIGRLTYDKSAEDPWWLTRFVCQHSDNIMHLIERNTSNSLYILRPFLKAMIDAQDKGIDLNTDDVGELSKYLNLLGGMYILDVMPEEWIEKKIAKKIEDIIKREHEKELKSPSEEESGKKNKKASNNKIIIVQENEKSPLIPIPVKNKLRTEPKSLVGACVGDTIKIGRKKYNVVEIK